MSTLSVLIGTRRLLNNPSDWTKDAEVRDVDGNVLENTTSAKGTSRCLIGGIRYVTATQSEGSVFDDVETIRVLSRVIAPFGNSSRSATMLTVSSFNDAQMTEHKDVLALLDSAICAIRGSSGWNSDCSVDLEATV